MSDLVRRYIDEAVGFVPGRKFGVEARRLRVARHLLSCGIAVAVLNELRLAEESDTAYRCVNVHNPRCPLTFDRTQGRWSCDPLFEDHPVWSINWAGASLICEHLGGRLPRAAEWECFASNNEPTRTYPWGNAPPTHLLANYDEHYGGHHRTVARGQCHWREQSL